MGRLRTPTSHDLWFPISKSVRVTPSGSINCILPMSFSHFLSSSSVVLAGGYLERIKFPLCTNSSRRWKQGVILQQQRQRQATTQGGVLRQTSGNTQQSSWIQQHVTRELARLQSVISMECEFRLPRVQSTYNSVQKLTNAGWKVG